MGGVLQTGTTLHVRLEGISGTIDVFERLALRGALTRLGLPPQARTR